MEEQRYVGFWMRTVATVIDTVIISVVLIVLLWAVYGSAYFTRPLPAPGDPLFQGTADFLIQVVLPLVLLFVFWKYRSATPGKMIIGAKIVDAETGNAPSGAQLTGRFFAYLISMIPLGFGFLWIAFDRRKQGWHDKLAKTAVVYSSSTNRPGSS